MQRLKTEGDVEPPHVRWSNMQSHQREPERGHEAVTLHWPNPEEEPTTNKVIPGDATTPKIEAISCATEREAKVGTGV
jgi:hypothetical protein